MFRVVQVVPRVCRVAPFPTRVSLPTPPLYNVAAPPTAAPLTPLRPGSMPTATYISSNEMARRRYTFMHVAQGLRARLALVALERKVGPTIPHNFAYEEVSVDAVFEKVFYELLTAEDVWKDSQVDLTETVFKRATWHLDHNDTHNVPRSSLISPYNPMTGANVNGVHPQQQPLQPQVPPAAKELALGQDAAQEEVKAEEAVPLSDEEEQRLEKAAAVYAEQVDVELYRKQLTLEIETVVLAAERYQQLVQTMSELRSASDLVPGQRLISGWFPALQAEIGKEINAIKQGKRGVDRKVYGPLIKDLDPSVLAALTIREVLNVLLYEGGEAKVSYLASIIGRLVNTEYSFRRMRTERGQPWKDFSRLSQSTHSARETIKAAERFLRMRNQQEVWDDTLQVKVGCLLLSKLIKACRVEGQIAHALGRVEEYEQPDDAEKGVTTPMTSPPTVDQPVSHVDADNKEFVSLSRPAFRHLKRSDENLVTSKKERPRRTRGAGYHMHGVIQMDEAVRRVFAGDQYNNSPPIHQPMWVLPRPWTSVHNGGYLATSYPLLRAAGNMSRQYTALRYSDSCQRVFDGVNALQSVPWLINERVCDVVNTLWDNGKRGGVAGLTRGWDDPMPEYPMFNQDSDHRQEWVKYRQDNANVIKTNRELFSLRCAIQYKLNVAEDFKGGKFYFPYNVDFRGRVYPMPPHLNHIGDDLSRGLLHFAEGRALGPRGLYWLKVHLANKCGFDKASFEDRVRYTEERMDLILRTAKEPTASVNMWWAQMENPFQVLACVFEIAAAVESGDPASHVCHLPVHQDGSCNGLQHYAAMGRDLHGGTSVNLTPMDQPQDVYTRVLDIVRDKLASAAEHPVTEVDELYAATLLKNVNRKVIKQTVMTSVYGVTFIGARAQIKARLEELDELEVPEPRDEHLQQMSVFLAKITLASLGGLFTEAKAIMDWLAATAGIVAKQCGQPMSWITPLGFPIAQPYYDERPQQVRTVLQSVLLKPKTTSKFETLKVNSKRQRTAFPPNFVHSLDSTHMLMTAVDCQQRGITFASVHDSYWTHPCDVDAMNASLREQFVNLYSEPILEELRDSLHLMFPGVAFPPVPPQGSLDLNLVKQSKYFFN